MRRSWNGHALLAALVGVYLLLAGTSLVDKSVTVDEFAHLPVGYQLLRTGDLGYCALNPPLMNALSALPVALMASLDGDFSPSGVDPGTFWSNGYVFMDSAGERYHGLYVAARWVTVLVTALLGVLVYGWARLLAPARPTLTGLVAAGLTLLTPSMLAHARLVTTDAGLAAAFALSLFSLHRYLNRPGPVRAFVLGLALGAAQLVKFTAVLLYPATLAIVPAWVWLVGGAMRGRSWRRIGAEMLLCFGVSLVVLNAGYLFQGTGRTLGDAELRSAPLQRLQSLFPSGLPLPVPADYAIAFDRQTRDVTQGTQVYLLGKTYSHGRWFYYPVVIAAKMALPALLLVVLAAVLAFRDPVRRADLALLLLLPSGLLLVVMSASNKQWGIRMLLPALPLLWTWTAATLGRARLDRRLNVVVAVLLVGCGVELARTHPHYLSYFSPVAGSHSRAWRVSVGSDLDWGQDLPALRRELERLGADRVQLLYFGRVEPALYGIDYTVPVGAEKGGPALLAIGASFHGLRYYVRDHGRHIGWIGPVSLDDPRLGEPVAHAGHSIIIYRMPE